MVLSNKLFVILNLKIMITTEFELQKYSHSNHNQQTTKNDRLV